MRKLLFLLVFLAISTNGYAKRSDILVLGDSWATFTHQHQSVERVLRDRGIGINKMRVRYLHFPGTRSDQWVKKYPKILLKRFIKHYKKIKYVLLFVGGNDGLKYLNYHMPEEEKEKIYDQIINNISILTKFILKIRPEIKIFMVGYTFPNFEDTIDNKIFTVNRHMWEELGSPSPYHANKLLVDLGLAKYQFAQEHENIYYINNYGLLQWKYGIKKYDIEPYELPHPGDIPGDGGDITLCPPKKGRLVLLKEFDSIHLDYFGQYELIDRVFDKLFDLQMLP